jgi:hypothetical protein
MGPFDSEKKQRRAEERLIGEVEIGVGSDVAKRTDVALDVPAYPSGHAAFAGAAAAVKDCTMRRLSTERTVRGIDTSQQVQLRLVALKFGSIRGLSSGQRAPASTTPPRVDPMVSPIGAFGTICVDGCRPMGVRDSLARHHVPAEVPMP